MRSSGHRSSSVVWGAVVLAASCVAASPAGTAASVPTLLEMQGSWIDLTKPISAHVNSSALDLPMIANFHGSVGSAPNGDWGVHKDQGGVVAGGVRPVDLLAINALEIPPFVGCGVSAAHGQPNGCGRMLIDGKSVAATATKYRADEVARRASTASGLLVDSRMRSKYTSNLPNLPVIHHNSP